MKIKYIVIMISAVSLCMLHNSCTEKQVTHHRFVSHLICAVQPSEDEFINHIQHKYYPIWLKLKDNNILEKLWVFKIDKIDSTTTNKTECNYLILAKLAPSTTAKEYLSLENFTDNSLSQKSPLFKIIRTELLNCRENVYYPPINLDKATDFEYYIEFIAVKDSSDFIQYYNYLMDNYFGPLNGELIKEGQLYCMFMMETTEVAYRINNSLNWNQIHISGDFPEYVNINWDSLYTDVFRRTFFCELDSVWSLLPPTLNSSFDCVGKLVNQLTLN